jgi:hypothetical protein
MLASRIMMRRTTVAADVEALATLEAEAQRRAVPLTIVLAEAVEEKAASLRFGRRPRVGVARSTDGLAARDVTDEPVARPPS